MIEESGKVGFFMKIFNNNVHKTMKLYKKQMDAKDIKKTNLISKSDKINISSKGKDFQVAMNALKKVPDVRQEKVDEIKNQIKSGTYNVDSGKIVEKIFENIGIDTKI